MKELNVIFLILYIISDLEDTLCDWNESAGELSTNKIYAINISDEYYETDKYTNFKIFNVEEDERR